MLSEAADTVGKVYGWPGAMIAGAVSGLFMETNGESRWMNVLKQAGKAAINAFTLKGSTKLLGKGNVVQSLNKLKN